MPKKDTEPPRVDNLVDLINFARLRSAMTGKSPFEALKGTPVIIRVNGRDLE